MGSSIGGLETYARLLDGKASGPDGLRAELLKLLAGEPSEVLEIVFNGRGDVG